MINVKRGEEIGSVNKSYCGMENRENKIKFSNQSLNALG